MNTTTEQLATIDEAVTDYVADYMLPHETPDEFLYSLARHAGVELTGRVSAESVARLAAVADFEPGDMRDRLQAAGVRVASVLP